MPRGSTLVPLVVMALVVGACSTVEPEDLGVPLVSTTAVDGDASTTTTAPGEDVLRDQLLDIDGEVAVAGLTELLVVDAAGDVLERIDGGGGLVTQPTWSRDGTRVIVSVLDAGDFSTLVVDRTDGVEVRRPSPRNYFFFSWRHDGDRIAALGPGPQGTTLDVLDADGMAISDDTVDATSIYLAWEPGGDDLLLHLDDQLELVRDVGNLAIREPLGAPGTSFLAPAWIPGTRQVLVVRDDPNGNRLIRLDVDTGDTDDLGPVRGGAGLAVSPDGTRALIAHGGPGAGGGDVAIVHPTPLRPVADISAPTEVIDLATSARTPVSALVSLWGEWSPDGGALALLQAVDEGSGAQWVVWNGAATRSLGRLFPSPVFFRDYVLYSWQFTESPRIWSPDGTAIVYGGTRDGRPGIFVQTLDSTESFRVSDGDVGFWSPQP